MVEDRIRIIEARIQTSTNLPDAAKAELLDLLAALRTELQSVEKDHLRRAEDSADGAEPAHGESLDDALGALTGTMTALEATHPRLAALANRLAVALANMGI